MTPMSHKGRPRLRTALFFAVMRLIRVDETFSQKYLRLQTREKNPLNKMQALGALMNKLSFDPSHASFREGEFGNSPQN